MIWLIGKFLKVVLEEKFQFEVVDWMRGCVLGTKFSIFLDGKPRGRVEVLSGCRQVDPPFFFPFLWSDIYIYIFYIDGVIS